MAEIIRTENLTYAYPADEGAAPALALRGVDLTIDMSCGADEDLCLWDVCTYLL